MFAVVLDKLEGDPAELTRRVVEVVGGTAYDVRATLTLPGGGPAVLSVIADPVRANEICSGLTKRGLCATVVSVGAAWSPFEVHRFSLDPTGLEVEDREGRQRSVRFEAVDLLIRASAVQTTVSTKKVRERKFSPVRSVLSGGLVNTAVKVTQKTRRETDSEELLFVYTREAQPLRLCEGALAYQGLGAALQPSRMANFLYLANAVAQGSTRARQDERLRRRSFQSQLLGRMLSPDDHIHFAVQLVAQSLRRPLPSQPRL